MKGQSEENGLGELFSSDKTLEEQKRNFFLMLSRISQETDQLSAIKAYKQLLRVNLEINAKYYQEIIIHLCRLLNKNGFLGEDYYYRSIVRYFFDSALAISPAFTRKSILSDLYSKIFLELKANPDKLNVIIFSDELKACQPLIEIVKGACDQQAIVILHLNDLLQYSEQVIDNYDILLVTANNKKSKSEQNIIKIFSEFKNKFFHSIIKAVYCSNSDTASYYYKAHNKEIDYFLFCNDMVFALLDIALKIS